MADEVEVLASSETTETTEAVATAETVETAGETTDETAAESETADEGEKSEPKPHKGGFQKRIEKLSSKLSAAEQEKEYWREQALRTQSTAKQETKTTDAEPQKPNKDTFDGDLDAYIEALADYKIAKAEREREAKEAKKVVESEFTKAEKAYQSRQDKLREEHDDYDDIADTTSTTLHSLKNTPSAGHVANAILLHEKGNELEYYLGQHPEEIKRIAQMRPDMALLEVGSLMAQFARKESAETKTAPPVTKAPKPPTPVTKSGGTTTVDLNDPNLPFKDWVKAREAELKRK